MYRLLTHDAHVAKQISSDATDMNVNRRRNIGGHHTVPVARTGTAPDSGHRSGEARLFVPDWFGDNSKRCGPIVAAASRCPAINGLAVVVKFEIYGLPTLGHFSEAHPTRADRVGTVPALATSIWAPALT